MGVKGKLVSLINIKSDGNAYYDFVRHKMREISNICPDIVQSVVLLEGQWGAVGSIISWKCTIGGTEMAAKEIIEGANEAQKSITYKVIEGDVLQYYDIFKLILNMDCSGDQDNLVTWTVEYEKKFESVPEPQAIMDGLVTMTKAIECKLMLVPN